jgi:regulator of replication initiation timing
MSFYNINFATTERPSAVTARQRDNITKLLAENAKLRKELEALKKKLAHLEKVNCDKVISKRPKEPLGQTL